MAAKNLDLKIAALRRGLRQRDIAIATGVSDDKISRIMSGLYTPSPELARRIAKLLRVRMSKVLAKQI